MAHHESEMSDTLRKHFQDEFGMLPSPDDLFAEAFKQRLGATGKFPDGKISDNDEGELAFAVATYKGNVIINFGKPIMSLGLLPEQARNLADLLLMKAGKAEQEIENSPSHTISDGDPGAGS